MELIRCIICGELNEEKAFDCLYCTAVLKSPKRNKLGKLALLITFLLNILFLIFYTYLKSKVGNYLILVSISNIILGIFLLLTRPKKY